MSPGTSRPRSGSRSSSRGRRMPRTAPGGSPRRTSTGCRSSVSASSASSARTSATFCASTICTTSSSAPACWFTPPPSRCTPWTSKTASRTSQRETASASATSPNAVRRSVRKGSRSPTMPSFRSRSGWSTSSTIPSGGSSRSSADRTEGRPAMFELKPLSRDAVPVALEKAHRYRLLNEPLEAESICRDVLEVDPDNQEALVTLLLSLTDQFDDHLSTAIEPAREALSRLRDNYSRQYYSGILCERRAKAHLKRGGPRAGHGRSE